MSKEEEIRERWDYPNADSLDWNDAKGDIQSLLTLLDQEREKVKELEGQLKVSDEIRIAEKKILIKEIEDHTKTKALLEEEKQKVKELKQKMFRQVTSCLEVF